MLGALSGCEKENSATEPVYNPISRLDAEVLLKQWNAERKGRLKSATTLNLTEEQWARTKVYLSEEEGRSLLTLPLAPGLRLCFGKAAGKAELFFCETRPDSTYLRQVAGKVEGTTFTGYLILYNQQGAGVVAYRYTDGGYEGAYHVMPRVCTLKDMTTNMHYVEEVVVTAPKKFSNVPTVEVCVVDFYSSPKGPKARETETLVDPFNADGLDRENPEPEPAVVPKIDDKKLADNPCAKLAWELLMNNCGFNELVSKFVGQHSLVNISLDVVNDLTSTTGKPCDGRTSPLYGDTYYISIDNEFASHANLVEVARVLVHEIIHAHLNYYVELCGRDLNELRKCYPDMYDRWNAYGFANNQTFQHAEMSDFYRTSMIEILKTIYPGLSDSMYNASSWGGLMETQAWNNLTIQEKTSILETIKGLRTTSNGNCISK